MNARSFWDTVTDVALIVVLLGSFGFFAFLLIHWGAAPAPVVYSMP